MVEYLADHIAVMQRGRIEEAGAADDLLRRPQTAHTRKMLAAVPRIDRAPLAPLPTP